MTKRKTKPLHKKVVHHAKRLYHITPKFIHGMGIGAFAGIVIVMTLGPMLPVSALTISSSRDWDTNAVLPGGALSTSELKSDYNSNYKSIKALYSTHFGISSQDIANIGETAQAGRVYKNGDVKIGDLLVATNAVTAGREYISGSTQVWAGDHRFYTREPKVSFRAQSIAAFVVMKDGKFKFAILAACANPVKATPIPTPEPTPPPEEEPPEEEPPIVVVSTQTPESRPLPAVMSETTTLPKTGPADIGLVIGLAIVGGYIYHVTHRHVRRRRQLRAHY